jgi:hypothetical protein
MKDTERAVIGLALLVGWAVATLTTAGVALLLTVAGWRPSAPPPVLALPPAEPVVMDALGCLRVAELRRLARAAGHKSLARTGRRAELLAALTP